MMRMSNAAARRATSWPIRPRPARPSVFSRTSSPRNFFFSHLPCFIALSAAGRWRAIARISPTASSATLTLFAPGAFITTMPRALAAATSTLSTPVPARAMTRSFGAAPMMADVTLVALRTTMASASATSPASCSGARPVRASTFQPSARSRSSADAGRSSATTIFNVGSGKRRRRRVDDVPRHQHSTPQLPQTPSIICGWRRRAISPRRATDSRRHGETFCVDPYRRVSVARLCNSRTTMVQTAKMFGIAWRSRISQGVFNRVFNRNCA